MSPFQFPHRRFLLSLACVLCSIVILFSLLRSTRCEDSFEWVRHHRQYWVGIVGGRLYIQYVHQPTIDNEFEPITHHAGARNPKSTTPPWWLGGFWVRHTTYSSSYSDTMTIVPLYPLILALLIYPLRAWRRAHGMAPGHCAQCGYDLRATPSQCPECGAPGTVQRDVANTGSIVVPSARPAATKIDA
jgi:hypothetical protein